MFNPDADWNDLNSIGEDMSDKVTDAAVTVIDTVAMSTGH